MLECAGRPVLRLELVKWSFLLAHETPSGGGKSFYQFVPYQHGPFSFCLYREVEALTRDGYVLDAHVGRREAWQTGRDSAQPPGVLPMGLRREISATVDRLRQTPVDRLLDDVYERYSWFTVNSAKRKLQRRPIAAPAVFTVGYSSWMVDGFLNLLLRAGVQRLLDVRRNPVSRQYGFHGSTLRRLCEKLQIEYVPFPELGIPSQLRQNLQAPEDYKTLFACYERDILRRETSVLRNIAALMTEKPSALMCTERDPSQCHRSRIAKAISEETALSIRHLGRTHEARV